MELRPNAREYKDVLLEIKWEKDKENRLVNKLQNEYRDYSRLKMLNKKVREMEEVLLRLDPKVYVEYIREGGGKVWGK